MFFGLKSTRYCTLHNYRGTKLIFANEQGSHCYFCEWTWHILYYGTHITISIK